MPNLPTPRDVNLLPDLRKAITMLKEFGLSINGVTNLEEAKEKLRYHFDMINKPKGRDLDLDIIKEDKVKRDTLLKKYQEARAYLEKLPNHIKADLEELFPNFQDTLESHIFDLRQQDCLIMLAGETGSGKSSLINMILGEKILPVSPLCCTASFCEIRGSKDGSKYAMVHFKKTGKSPLRLDLSSKEGLKQLVEYVQLPNDPDVDCESSIVKVYWPSVILKEGVVLVDTPGIGENKEMISYLASYMSKAFGFIYVINAASAGGVQKDRLSRLLRTINDSNSEVEYLTEATIFVSNKWESIAPNEKKEVREDTLEKLRRFYPNLLDEQLICLSVNTLMQQLKDKTPAAELSQFYMAVKKLIPAMTKNKIFLSYKWLTSLLKRSAYSLKVKTHVGNRNKVDKSELYSTLRRKITILEKQSISYIGELRTEIQKELSIINESLLVYLKSETVKQDLNAWSSVTVLSASASHWREIGQQAIDLVGSKIMLLINEWERSNSIVGNLNTHMVKKFKGRFDKLEMQIYDVESKLAGDKVARNLQHSVKKPFKPIGIMNIFQRGNEVNIQNNASVIGFNISSLGHVPLDKKDIKKKLKSVLNSKNKTKELMQEVSKHYVASIVEHENLPRVLAKFFNRTFKDIDIISSRLPEFLRADQALLTNIEREFYKTETNFSEMLPDYITVCNQLQGNLDMFYVKELFVPDIDLKQIELRPEEPPLGTGSFATVFLCYLKTNNGSKKAAMKAWSDKLSSSNVSDTLLEDSILREIKHKNIIQYYGSNYRRLQDGSLQWLMILEYCFTTLKNIFIRDDDKYHVNPAKYSSQNKQRSAMVNLCKFVVQLCEAISYLHQKNLVHRDLKMENILVTEDKVIKLTDVGLSKLERDIAGSIAGSPCFMAPEIFERKVIYGKKADIYSLSIIMWEMWYGIDVVTYIRPLIQKGIEESVIGGLRPSFQLTEKPPENFKTLVQKCWNSDPQKRPEVEECTAFFKTFL